VKEKEETNQKVERILKEKDEAKQHVERVNRPSKKYIKQFQR